MSAIRDEIRAILREEISLLRAGGAGRPIGQPIGQPVGQPAVPVTEMVHIQGGADLTRFAQELVARAKDPAFAADVANGMISFDLLQTVPQASVQRVPVIVASPAKPAQDPHFDKALITEKDIAGLGSGLRSLRIGRTSRLTPLAQDEARRRGIRVERSAT